MDLYKYVDDIKYNFDYSQNSISETKSKYLADYHKHLDEEYLRVVKNQY